jgi:hypothetical protein
MMWANCWLTHENRYKSHATVFRFEAPVAKDYMVDVQISEVGMALMQFITVS